MGSIGKALGCYLRKDSRKVMRAGSYIKFHGCPVACYDTVCMFPSLNQIGKEVSFLRGRGTQRMDFQALTSSCFDSPLSFIQT